MKKLIFVLSVFLIHSVNGQSSKPIKSLFILDIKDGGNGYLLTGLDSLKSDTLYFVSVKDSLPSHDSYTKIAIGKKYNFVIEDIDNINGHMPSALPNGYYVKFGKRRLKRDSRNGKTITTTQFYSKNTKGLYIQNE